jgi:lysophospholipase L1-like esterase
MKTSHYNILALFFLLLSDFSSAPVSADSISSFYFSRNFALQDVNNDGQVKLLAFGDSITRGVGDFHEPGEFIRSVNFAPIGEAGYPLRLEIWLNLPVQNRGVPGERINTGGVFRFAPTLARSDSDHVIISEGANDAFSAYSSANLARDLQAMINIASAMGKKPILMTIPPPCCDRSGLRPFVEEYNLRYRDLASVNRVPLADSDRGFRHVCPQARCPLLNLPEGLHPNSRGYDVIGEVLAASFYNINLFTPGGSADLADVLGIPENQLQIKSPSQELQPEAETPSSRLEKEIMEFYYAPSMYNPEEFPYGW